ncbi:MAG: aldehyde ferredoxin oxidoreductase C-terminal domain-containing protein [Bacillota bacterium]|nr:aldehyde ferredoxin oxidoreductase C-terminal domain-containing protein [Bacillota bacterium]
MSKIIRVNLTSGSITSEEVPDKYKQLGGRALTAQILLDEIDPACEPLGRHNKLVIAPGLLGGSFLSSSSRLSIGGKSPLTGGIKESNAGGTAAQALSKLGIKAVILEGESNLDYCQYLFLGNQESALKPAEFAGMGVYQSSKLLFERYGDKVSLILIGPAGEKGLPVAGITNTDPQGRPGRFSGRGGLGAVMGTKGLKAIVLDPAGKEGIKYHDRKAFQELNKELVKILRENPATGEAYPKYGTAAMVTRTNALYALPTRNFSEGTFEFANRIDGDYLFNTIMKRGGAGNPTHACMPGCVIKCSNVYADSSGSEIVSPLEYETIGLIGSNCGIGNLDDIASLNYICNDLGIDTIEVGAAIGVAMDQGLIPFGDAAAAEELLSEIADFTIMGRVLGQGALITGRILGSKRIPVVKGQSLAAYDPRAIKGLGVTYATSPMGADHTAGNTIRNQVEHTDPEPQVELSLKAQKMSMMADSLGLCLFLMPALGSELDKIAELLDYYVGIETSGEKLLEDASRSLSVEREFNRRAGFGPAADRLPEFMLEEPLPALKSVFDVPSDKMRQITEL